MPIDPPRSSGPLAPGVSGGDGYGIFGSRQARETAERVGRKLLDTRCENGHGDLYDCNQPNECTRAVCARDDDAPLAEPAPVTEHNRLFGAYYDDTDFPAPHTPDSARFPIGQRMGPLDDSASVATSGVRVYPGARERGPLQRPHSAFRGLWDRVQHPRAYLGEPGLQRGAVARVGGAARFRRIDAVCKVRLDALVDKIRVRSGVKR